MFFIWGTRHTSKKLGFVAEECPRCQEVRCVKVNRLGMAGHIFFVSFSSGNLVGFAAECQQCNGVFDVLPMNYARMERSKKMPMDALVAATHPRLEPNNVQAQEASHRSAELRDPFVRFGASLQDRYRNGKRFDMLSGLTLLATFFVPIPLGLFAASVFPSAQNPLMLAGLMLFPVGLVATSVFMYREPRRFFDRQLRNELVKNLKPLNASQTELDACLGSLKKYGYRIQKFVTAEGLLQDTRRA